MNVIREYSNPFYTLLVANGISDFGMLIFSIYSFMYDLLNYPYLGVWVDSLIAYIFYWSLGWYCTQMFTLAITLLYFSCLVFVIVHVTRFHYMYDPQTERRLF
uniref:NADH dehydrogenase subunit 6 n=1 Tax=Romanomermis culicivorax TaxID=13658 RepID=A0A915KKH7_ROMCU